jgi:hypothetical protein
MVVAFLDILMVALFELRTQYALAQLTTVPRYGSIQYEYEKNAYPLAMADILFGDKDQALAFLQQLDPQASQTLEIDLHSSFTLKAQTRKYFHFGDQLDPLYRDRMQAAMRQLTETDPLTRQANPPRKFWQNSQDDCDTLIDCRNTDNLRAMRDTSIYLMAEATQNETTRQLYKQHIQRYVSTLLDIGMGEWDSPTYHGHTTTAYLNLYDFAQDPEVKQLAQTALDWLFTQAAYKYWRGNWNGPAKRIYGNGSAAFFWLYFGDALPPQDFEHDWLYAITSTYRPPQSALTIASHRPNTPFERQRTHPHYENWKPELYGPAFHETLYVAHTYQLGSLAEGTGGDWSGFSLSVRSALATTEIPITATSPHTIAQYNNLLLWQGETEPTIDLPCQSIENYRTLRRKITFAACEQTWLALFPIRNGFALEVGEASSHGNFATFRQSVLNHSHLRVQGSRITYQSSQGHTLQMDYQNSALPMVWRDGLQHNWTTHGQEYSKRRMLSDINHIGFFRGFGEGLGMR